MARKALKPHTPDPAFIKAWTKTNTTLDVLVSPTTLYEGWAKAVEDVIGEQLPAPTSKHFKQVWYIFRDFRECMSFHDYPHDHDEFFRFISFLASNWGIGGSAMSKMLSSYGLASSICYMAESYPTIERMCTHQNASDLTVLYIKAHLSPLKNEQNSQTMT